MLLPIMTWLDQLSLTLLLFFPTRFYSSYSDPRARSDSNGESEPKPGDARFISFIFRVINFFFQKCRDPNPRPDQNGGFEPEPGLLRRFHLSYQNILLIRLVAEAVSVLGKPIIIYKFMQFGRPINI